MTEAAAAEEPAPQAEPSAPALTVDPQTLPPHTLNADQAQAVHGRLADVDADYAPVGSNQEAQSIPRPEPVEEEPEAPPLDEEGDEPEGDDEPADDGEAEAEAGEAPAVDDMTVSELKAELDQREVEYDQRALKAELQELVTEARAAG
jgi:HeH/LEM domain